MSGLKCPVPGCKKVIYALTGLQELQKLQQHYKRAHLARLNIEDALELRARIEAEQERDHG